MAQDPWTKSVDSVATRTGLTRDAVAILFIVAGIIILIWPEIISVALGVLLIVVGVVWLVTSMRERQAASRPPSP